MEWLLPAGAWAFWGIMVVIVLYLLRRKATRIVVPSLLLWQKTQSAQEASKPFQRLRKSWLLILQLLLVTLMAFALLRPALPGGPQGELALVFDVSASMQAKAGNSSRLEWAVKDALTLVDGMKDGDTVTVLTAGSRVGQALTRSTDKQKIRAVLNALEAENGGANMDGALSLAQAMRRDLPELSIIVYSDSYEGPTGTWAKDEAMAGSGMSIRAVGIPADNRSILSLRCSPQEDGLIAFARVANYGAAAEVTIECYADGALCDLRTLALLEGGEESVQFTVPMDASSVWVTLKTPDALMADDIRFWVAQEARQRTVLLVTPSNVFLEKALALRQDIQVLKTTGADGGSMEGYDLVILDGESPENLPETGSILALSPGREILGIQPGGSATAGGALQAETSALAQLLTKNLLLTEFSLRTFTPLSGGQGILTWGESTLLAVSQQAGRRAAVFGFDLHDSNLPMKPDFPILMQNLMDYLLPDAVGAVDATSAEQPVVIVPDERAVSVREVTPSGREVTVEGETITDTGEIGIYALREERVDGTQRITPFVLHMAPSEADVRQVATSTQEEQTEMMQRRGTGREWTVFLLLAALLLLLVEWEVSRRGA